jgi:hypothetical protein
MARRHPEDIEGLESTTEVGGEVFRYLNKVNQAEKDL